MVESKTPLQTPYRLGRALEYRVRDHLRDNGYDLVRAAGSKGAVDIVAFKSWNAGEPFTEWLFVQVKRRGGTIPPAERTELLRLAALAHATPLVAHQPVPRQPIVYRRLTGPGPKDWQPWSPDELA